jgi:hydroxyacylglutathione hydrolase
MIKEMIIGNLQVWVLSCLEDNYVFVLHDSKTQTTVVVDPAEAQVVNKLLASRALNLSEIWITHHHADHVGGVSQLHQEHKAEVRGSLQIPGRIPCVTKAIDKASSWKFGEWTVSVLALPGHTLDHVGYWLSREQDSLLFSGDVLFGMGCGRIFEGTNEQMLESLTQIANLPDCTQVFCSHEYTERNLEFHLQQEPVNDATIMRRDRVRTLRRQRLPTVPLALQEEKETNLFLRVLREKSPLEMFRALREARNHF